MTFITTWIISLVLFVPVNSLPPEFPAKDLFEVRDLLLFYAHCGITYKVISNLMNKFHGIIISDNAIAKRLRRYGERRRSGQYAVANNELLLIIKEELKLLPRSVGYRQMTNILQHKGLNVRRDQVMSLMRQADPEGVQYRRRHRLQRRRYMSPGPNNTWHIDGYDKLKPYGFSIHGCIDGYSRKIMWLAVGPSNNDPKQVAFHYMTRVDTLKGVPTTVQADKGTENSVIGALQCVFKENDPDFNQQESFQHISSQLNQRIEAWWSIFRKRTSQWWMDFFKDLVDSGSYSPCYPTAVKCMRYSFMQLIQKDLDNVVEQWNNHQMTVSRNSLCPNGRPNVLYSVPELSGGKDCLHHVDDECIAFGFSKSVQPNISGDDEFDNFAMETGRHFRWKTPTTWKEALMQYFCLIEVV